MTEPASAMLKATADKCRASFGGIEKACPELRKLLDLAACDLEAAASIICHNIEMPKWRPIETAPKDGTDILLGCATWKRPELGQWSVETAAWFTDGGGYEDGEVANGPDEVDSPTHWQPLPANPA